MTLQTLLLAFATFRQRVQPEWYAHIHSHGHAQLDWLGLYCSLF